MLINCPRCGFSQPKDKYCAQCGVDMETFVPSGPPLSKKIFGSTFFQGSVLFMLAIAAALFVYQKRHENLEARVQYLKGSVQVSSTDSQASDRTSANVVESSSTAGDSEEAATEVVEAKAMIAPLATDKTDKADKGDKKEDAKPAAKAGPTIRVTYAEVAKNVLRSFFEESQGSGQFMSFKDYSAGIVPGLDKKITSSGVRILYREDYPLAVGKNLQWFYGLKDRTEPDLEVGMTTFIELGEMDGSNYRGNLEIQRSWREPGGIQRRSFPAMFEIGANSGFFISSVMPTKSNLENDDELTSIDVYKILKSEDFQRGDSDFVIFVELGNNPAK